MHINFIGYVICLQKILQFQCFFSIIHINVENNAPLYALSVCPDINYIFVINVSNI